jgi:hypothetical protein
MSKICNKCGYVIRDMSSICPCCGEFVSDFQNYGCAFSEHLINPPNKEKIEDEVKKCIAEYLNRVKKEKGIKYFTIKNLKTFAEHKVNFLIEFEIKDGKVKMEIPVE